MKRFLSSLFAVASTAIIICVNLKLPAQVVTPGVVLRAGSATGSFTLVQSAHNDACAGFPCTITTSSTLTGGNLYYFCVTGNAGALITSAQSNSVSLGTLVTMPGSQMFHTACSYILPSTSVTSANTSIVLNNSANSSAYSIWLYELHPSANGSLVGLDCDSAQLTLSTNSAPGAACTFSGTGTAMFQAYVGSVTNANASAAPASPYNVGANNIFPNAGPPSATASALALAPANGNAPTWSRSGGTLPDNAYTIASAFSFSPAACIEEIFQRFDGGGSGNAPTNAALQTSAVGWHGGDNQWNVTDASSHLKYASGANFPTQTSPRLCGDGNTVSAGAGAVGVQETGTGSAAAAYIQQTFYNNDGSGRFGPVSASVWFCSDLVASDASNIDIFIISGFSGDFADVQFLGNGVTRTFKLETSAGANGAITYTPNGSCSGGGGTWVNIQVQYNQGVSANAQMAVFNSSGTQIGSTVTQAQAASNGHPAQTAIGHIGSQSLTNGVHLNWDSWQVNLSGTFPLPNQ